MVLDTVRDNIAKLDAAAPRLPWGTGERRRGVAQESIRFIVRGRAGRGQGSSLEAESGRVAGGASVTPSAQRGVCIFARDRQAFERPPECRSVRSPLRGSLRRRGLCCRTPAAHRLTTDD